ncbi:MAG: L-threonylcarbamoyladenylate synthase, partial [Rhodothermaceae bacterium]|nr:L-threonylcarbamoyladenylate synthase [Rhodothermaceae bacterium]
RVPVFGADGEGIREAADVVASGGVVLYPTETVYGLGGDPHEVVVMERIRRLKGRDADKPVLVLTDDWARVVAWLDGVSEAHRRLMTHEPPLPVTLLFDAASATPPWLVGPDGWVGVRRTSDLFCRAVIGRADCALLSTSANEAGGTAPHQFDDVPSAIREGVDCAIDAGQPLAGTPSTVIRFDGEDLVAIREGAVHVKTLREIIG